MPDYTPYVMAIVIFFIHFLIIGHMFSFGFLIPTFTNAFAQPLTLVQITVVGSTQIGMFYSTYTIYDELINRVFKPRTVTTLAFGSFLWFTGVLSTSFVSDFSTLVVTHGVITGIGISLCYWGTFVTRSQWGITPFLTTLIMLGSSAGELFFSLVVSNFYQNVEVLNQQQWRFTFQLISAIGGCGLIASCFITNLYNPIIPSAPKADTPPPTKNNHTFVYVLLCATVFFAYFSTTVPSIHLVPYMIERGWNDFTRTATIFVVTGTIAGRFFIAVAIRITGSSALMVFSSLFSMASMFGWLGCIDLAGVYAFAFLFGFATGCEASILPILIEDIETKFGRLTNAINTMSFIALFCMTPGAIVSPILVGALRARTGNYVIPILVASMYQLIAVFIAVILVIILNRQSAKVEVE